MVRHLLACLGFIAVATLPAHSKETPPVPGNIITIKLLPGGAAVMGKDTLQPDELSKELQQRLFKSYMGTGKMYDAIKLEYSGEILMGARDAAKDAIHKAQQNTLKELCLEKHKKLFEDINSRQQEKIRKQFPVLFQTHFD
jgi:hypothetical protein